MSHTPGERGAGSRGAGWPSFLTLAPTVAALRRDAR
jgi:hypothetical protein